MINFRIYIFIIFIIFFQIISCELSVDSKNIILSKIPQPLIKLGLKLFDNNETYFLDIINSIEEPQELTVEGMSLSFVQYKGDTSISRLRDEFAKNDNYGLTRLDNIINGTFIDIGANLGAISIFVAKKYYSKNLTVISFEPIHTTFFLFRYNMYLNQVHHGQNHSDLSINNNDTKLIGPEIYAFNNAFGSEFATLEFVASKALSQFSAQSDRSIDDLKKENGLDWVTYKIAVVPLNFIENHFHINVVDFLKLDCEGCEFDLIVSLKDFFINKNRLKYLGAEIHLSLMDKNELTLAKKPSSDVADKMLNILRERGCGRINWQISC